MNVCIITFQYPPMINGGVGSATYRIARNLANTGLNVHVIAPGRHRVEEPIVPVWEEGITVHRTFPALGNYCGDSLELREIGNYVEKLHYEIDFDLIHGMFLMPAGLVAAVVAKVINRPLIVSVRGSDVESMRYDPLLSGSIRWVLEQASLVTALTSEFEEKVKQIADVQAIRVIPNSLDLKIFDHRRLQEIAREQSWSYRLYVRMFLKKKAQGGPVIGTSGLIRPVKGFPFLLGAFNDLSKVCPKALLLVVGDFINQKEKTEWLQRIKKLGLGRQVLITGRLLHKHILAWMQEMDIFVFPSLYEGTSNALLEAMGCGLPVVASNIGGLNAVVTDGQNGLLAPPRSVDTLSQSLKTLVRDKDLRIQLGKSASQTVATHFSPEHEARAWITAYQDAKDAPSKSKKDFSSIDFVEAGCAAEKINHP